MVVNDPDQMKPQISWQKSFDYFSIVPDHESQIRGRLQDNLS